MRLLLIASLLLSGCSLKSQQIGHVTLQGADVFSTTYAEARGGVEANPLMQVNVPTRIALKSAQAAGIIWITQKLDHSGHPRAAKVLLWSLNSLMAGVTINNVRIVQ